MADTILSGDFTVYYKAENRQQRIVWTGTSGTRTVRELYSALMDLFDESAQMDDSIPMSSQTPTEYTIGKIEAVDTDSWFIDNESTKHLKGGSISTASWARVQDSNTGIVHIYYEVGGGNNFIASDLGKTITHTDGDSGTLLDFHIHADGTLGVVIRPASSAAANNWDSSSGTIAVTSGTGSVTQLSPASSGNSLWASVFTLGTIASGTEIYVVQNSIKLITWWSTGHIDILVQVQRSGSLTDFGLLTIYAREFGVLYDHFTVDGSSGGRNPVPISTSADVNNTTAEGTIAALTGITFTYGATQEDIGDGNGDQPYDVLINCGGNTIKDFYEYTKYTTRRTATTPLSTAYYDRDGEQYIVVGELRIAYDGQTGAFTEGEVLTGPSGTAFIIADHNNGDNTGTLIVRDVRGTFSDNNALTDAVTGVANVFGDPEDTIVVKVAPFGTFAGGRFFGARGVWITNVHANDSNNYQLIDSNGVIRNPPVSVPIVVGGLVSGDSVSVFRATGAGEGPHKTYLTSTALDNSAGDTTFIVQESIPGDTPAEGTLRLVDKFTDSTQNKEYRIRYSSWATSTFTFASQTGLDANGTNSTTLTDSGATFQTWGIRHGDMIRNLTEDVIAYVVSVESQTELITTAVTDWTGDDYEINTFPINATIDDTAYVPYIDAQATGASLSVSVTYAEDRPLIARVRRKGIVPFSISGSLTTSGATFSAIRTTDNIAQ